MKNCLKKSLAFLLAFMMVFSFIAYVEPIEAGARATINTYRKTDKYGTPVWDGSNTYYSKWNSGSSYTTFTWPKHIYMDVSETLESAGYYYTVEWDYGNGTDYRIVNNGFIFGGWRLQNPSSWPANYNTMNNMFNNYDLDASTHGTQDGIDGGSSTDFDLKIGNDNWDGAQVIIWRNPNNDNNAQHQYVFMKGSPKTTGYGLYSTSGAKPNSFGGWQSWNNGWKSASDKYTTSNDSNNWTTDCYEGTWKEVRFEITIYDKSELNYAKQKADTIYSNNSSYSNYSTAGYANFVTQRNTTSDVLKTRVITQDGLTAQITNLSNAANAMKFAASNNTLLTAISNARAKMAEADYATKYTQASRNALATALDNATASSYDDGVATYTVNFSDNSTWNAGSKAAADQTAINNYATAINNAIAGLKNSYSITFKFANGTTDSKVYDDGATVSVPANSTKAPDATNHYSYSWTPSVSTTANANVTYTESLKTVPHSWSEWTQTKAPTCTAEGLKQRECTECGYVESDTVKENGHKAADAVNESIKESDCTAEGSYDEVVYCSVCGEELSRTPHIIAKLPHEAKAAVTEKLVPATCAKEGSYDEVVYCKNCSEELSRTPRTIEKLPHEAKAAVTEKLVPATCTKEGSYDEVVYCKNCPAELSRTTHAIEKLDHESAAAVTENLVPSSCTKEGSYDEVVYCKNCPAELSRTSHTIAKLPHESDDAVTENVVPSSCTKEGSYDEVVYCKNCPAELSRTPRTIDKLDHKAADAVKENVKKETCTAEGYYEAVVCCSVCGTELSRVPTVVPKADHEYVYHDAQLPSCSENGWFAYETCKNCDYSTYEYIEATGAHIYATEVEKAEATCLEDGYVINACTCGAEEKTVLKATDHEWGNWTVDTPATCVDGGVEKRVCKNDSAHFETKTIASTGHTPAAAVTENLVPATCTKEGSYDAVVYCKNCPEELSRTSHVIDNTDHEEATAVTENFVPATCAEEGSYDAVVYCKNCPEELSRTSHTIKKLSHEAAAAVTENLVPATCAKEGSYDNVVYCKNCSAELSRTSVKVSVTDHQYVDHKAQLPTCSEGGWKAYQTCKNCDYSTYEYIAATGKHIFTEKERLAATCLDDGYVILVCCECGKEEKTVIKAAGSHAWSEWIKIKAPTATENGEEMSICDNCGGKKTRIIPAIGTDTENPSPSPTPDQPDTPDTPDDDSSDKCSCSCHSKNSLVSFFFKLFTFIRKLFGMEEYRYCNCGIAHW